MTLTVEEPHVCGPTVAWNWLTLDVAYVLVLVGGAMVLRARRTILHTWVLFGVLSALVGGILFAMTYATGFASATAPPSTDSAITLLENC